MHHIACNSLIIYSFISNLHEKLSILTFMLMTFLFESPGNNMRTNCVECGIFSHIILLRGTYHIRTWKYVRSFKAYELHNSSILLINIQSREITRYCL